MLMDKFKRYYTSEHLFISSYNPQMTRAAFALKHLNKVIRGILELRIFPRARTVDVFLLRGTLLKKMKMN